jgi:ribonuclease HII
MAVLAGIDEAGFGPILGPLVVSSTAFSIPEKMLEKNLWRVLNKSVADKRKHLAGRILIADSKKVHNKKDGLRHLRRAVLACLQLLGKNPETLAELLEMLCPDCPARLEAYPWHGNIKTEPVSGAQADVAIASNVLAQDLRANNMKLLDIHSRCLDVAYYNRMVASVKNKASVLFTAACQLIQKAFDDFGRDNLNIIIDRQGGRSRYAASLLRMFPHTELVVLKENQKLSSYELKDHAKKMRLHFIVGADDRFLPVSLASMVSKFLRELLVADMNRYFVTLHSALRPTAGYWKDGSRFIEDLKKVPGITFDSNQLVRCR